MDADYNFFKRLGKDRDVAVPVVLLSLTDRRSAAMAQPFETKSIDPEKDCGRELYPDVPGLSKEVQPALRSIPQFGAHI